VDVLKRPDLDRVKLAGRTLQKAVGGPGEGKVTSTRTTGRARPVRADSGGWSAIGTLSAITA
jgi:hypothetical protein